MRLQSMKARQELFRDRRFQYCWMVSVAALLVASGTSAGQLPVRVVKPDDQSGPVAGCFGKAVAISGDFAYVGDPCESSPTQFSAGAVYRAHRQGSGWVIDQRIQSPNPVLYGEFGASLAFDGFRLGIGAPGEGTGGRIYEYMNTPDQLEFGVAWGPFLGDQSARFGASIAPYVVIANFVGGSPAGSCYTGAVGGFVFPASAFNFYLCDPDKLTPGKFGTSLASHKGYMLIGAPGDGSVQVPSGAGYLYAMGIPGYQSVLKAVFVPTDPSVARRFGVALDLGDTDAVFGAPIGAADQHGQVWVYHENDSIWSLNAVLEEPVDGPTSLFGSSVALSGDLLWVGAPTTAGGGAVYSYSRTAGGWTVSNSYHSDDLDASSSMGASLGADRATWIAGAPNGNIFEPDNWTGVVYISADDYVFKGDFDR